MDSYTLPSILLQYDRQVQSMYIKKKLSSLIVENNLLKLIFSECFWYASSLNKDNKELTLCNSENVL